MTLNQILESAEKLSYDQIDLLIGVLYKRQIEARRDEIARNAREAIESFHRGELKTESADELIMRLHACPESEDE